MPPVIRRTIILYSDDNGLEPFTEWYQSIKDHGIKSRIGIEIKRLEKGSLGDHQSILENSRVCELRFNFEPGYRVYYAEDGLNVIVLLGAGEASSQQRGAKQAVLRWQAYLIRKDHESKKFHYRTWATHMQVQLADLEHARAHLVVAIEGYLRYQELSIFVDSIREVVEAQIGMERLAQITGHSEDKLIDMFAEEETPDLRTMLTILQEIEALAKPAHNESV